MLTEFQGKVILITGSSKGIGKALAIHLGLRGAKIGLNGRNTETLSKTNSKLREMGIDCLMVPGDVTDYEVCESIVNDLIKNFGRLDCVVSNGSMMSEASILEIDPKVFKTVIESQIIGAVFPVKAALPALIKSKGYILMISSLAAFYGMPRYSSYSMGKVAHRNFAQSLDLEMNNKGVDIGVAYVCFTKNELDKQMIAPDGHLSSLPHRPGNMQLSREKVANGLAKMILRRKRSYVLSLYGKAYSVVIKLFPGLMRYIFRKKLPV